MVQIPYELIGTVIVFFFGVYAFYDSYGKVRLFFGVGIILLFVIPFLFPVPVPGILILLFRMVFGFIAIIYEKYKSS